MRLALLLLAATGFAIWWGGHNLSLALRNRTPLEISCADFVSHRPDAEWLRLTHCDPAFDQLAYESSTEGGAVTTAYIPLRPEGTDTGAMKIIVERTDDEMKELAGRLKGAADISDKTVERLHAAFAGPVEGTVEVGLDLSDSRQQELAKLDLGLDKDFVILEYGKEPRPLIYALAALAGGVLGLGAIVGSFVRRRRRTAVA